MAPFVHIHQTPLRNSHVLIYILIWEEQTLIVLLMGSDFPMFHLSVCMLQIWQFNLQCCLRNDKLWLKKWVGVGQMKSWWGVGREMDKGWQKTIKAEEAARERVHLGEVNKVWLEQSKRCRKSNHRRPYGPCRVCNLPQSNSSQLKWFKNIDDRI